LEYANEFRYFRTLRYPPDADLAKIRNYEEVTEKRAVQRFIDGLGGTLAERVYSRAPETVADAIKFAVHEELSPAYKHSKVVGVGEVRAIDSDTVTFYCKQRGHGIATCEKRRGQTREHRESRRDGAPLMRPHTSERRPEFSQTRNQAPRTRNTNNFREELGRRTGFTSFARHFFARYLICATFQLRDFSDARHFNCAISHLRHFPFARLFNSATSHLRDFSIARHPIWWEGEEGYPGPRSDPRFETALMGPITTLKGPTPNQMRTNNPSMHGNHR